MMRRRNVANRLAEGFPSLPVTAVKSRAGFSLIELVVVLALVLVLTTLYWGSSSDSRQRLRQQACAENLRRIHMALAIYANEFAGKFPVATGARTSNQALALLVPKYTVETALFICPAVRSAPAPGVTLLDGQLSYAYYMGLCTTNPSAPLLSDQQVNPSPGQAQSGLFSTTGKGSGSNHGRAGGNVLFVDGHVDWIPAGSPFSPDLTSGGVLLNPKP